MGRWDQYGERIDFKPGHSWYSYAKENSCAKAIIRAHNADCAAYEARIAELEATVARVKAESLRVVRVQSENEINFGAFVRHIFLDGKFVRLEYWEDQG